MMVIKGGDSRGLHQLYTYFTLAHSCSVYTLGEKLRKLISHLMKIQNGGLKN